MSLLRELLGEYKKGSPSDKQQELAVLSRIELLLNTSIQDLTSRLDTVESNTDLLLRHSNISHNTLTSIDDKLEDFSNKCASPLLQSCEEIKRRCSGCPSGYYIIAGNCSIAHQVYCYMEELCNSTGGWMRVAHLNMTDNNEKCPDEFRLYSENGVRACGRPVSSGGSCVGITFPSGNIEYSQVCGKVIRYQVGASDGTRTKTNNINSQLFYADGVSLTHGNPRSHIWTFMVGQAENVDFSHCPCGTPNPPTSPSFIGRDYYCESGNLDSHYTHGKFYPNDPLWDGHQCGNKETACCQRTGIPWFNKKFNYSTTDYIEMSICLDEPTSDEDCAVGHYEIYVKEFVR